MIAAGAGLGGGCPTDAAATAADDRVFVVQILST